MRIWSLHPRFLDTKGLVACWRETLLAQKVLLGQTKGYKNHSQLERFKAHKKPIVAIGTYLHFIYEEACRRGYSFSVDKICEKDETIKMMVTDGQVQYEWGHLSHKLQSRCPKTYKNNLAVIDRSHNCQYFVHPMFDVKHGEIESWEKT